MKFYSPRTRNYYHNRCGSFSTRLSSELSIKTNSYIQNSLTSANILKYTDYSNKYVSFHKELLRDSIHRNDKYKHLFSTNPSCSSPQLITNKNKEHKTPTQNKLYIKHVDYCDIANNKKQTHTYTHTHTHTHTQSSSPKNVMRMSSYNTKMPFCKQRAYTLTEFTNAVQNIRKEKYKLSIQKHELKKLNCDIENNISLVNQNLNTYSYSARLLNSFSKGYDLYMKYLEKTKEKEIEKCETLKQIRNRLITEIQRLKRKQDNLQNTFATNLKTKHFLISVKNCTTDINKFSPEDQQEIEHDEIRYQRVLNPDIISFKKSQSINDKSNIITAFKEDRHVQRKHSKRKNTLKRLKKNSKIYFDGITSSTPRALMNKNFFFLYQSKRNYTLFKSPEEFNILLNTLTNNINLQIHEYNLIQNDILKLKQHKTQIADEHRKNQLRLDLKNEMKMCLNKLNHLKKQNETLVSLKNNLVFQNENYYTKLQLKIQEMFTFTQEYQNIREYNNPNTIITLNPIKALSDIEVFVMNLLYKNKELKMKLPHCYKKVKTIQDQTNKILTFKLFKEKQHINFIEKMQNIIHTSQKLYMLPHKKVDNKDYLYLDKLKRIKDLEKQEQLLQAQRGLSLSDYI